jgi:selT/selW/selH-like putative selenoprotein
MLTIKDVFFRKASPESEDGSDESHEGQPLSSSGNKKIPHTNLSHILTGPSLKILYCHSCGYRKAFEEYAAILRDKYPEITVTGDNYPPSAIGSVLLQTISMLKMAIILMILTNVNPFQLVGWETPGIWNWLSNSKIYGCLMTFFICNTIEGQLISSGAFEIYYNDLPIWSKIDTGRIPAPAELFQIIDNQNFNNKPGVFQY